MISLINSLCITLIFTAWVWTLKQEIGSLGPVAHDAPDGADEQEEGHAQAHHRGPVRRTDSALYDQNGKQRDKSGVATWTIA